MSTRSITSRVVVAVAIVASAVILGLIASNIFYKPKISDESPHQVADWLNIAFVGAAEQVIPTRHHAMVKRGMPQPSSRRKLVEDTNLSSSPTQIRPSDSPSAKPSQRPSAIVLTIKVCIVYTVSLECTKQ